MNIKGKIEGVQKTKDNYIYILSTKEGSANIFSSSEIPYLKKEFSVSFMGIEEKKSIFKKSLYVRDDTLISIYPKFVFKTDEVKLASNCRFGPLLFEFVSKLPKENENEKHFIENVKNLREDSEFGPIAERFPKDIKAKFAFRPYEVSTDYGLYIRHALYLGKLPVVFANNEIKAKVQSILSGSDRFIVIDPQTSTMSEKKIETKEKKEILNYRNYVLMEMKEVNIKDLANQECSKECPVYEICLGLKEINLETFEPLLRSFAKETYKNRKKLVSELLPSKTPKRNELPVFGVQMSNFEIEGNIRDNEVHISENQPVLVIERPPLDRKTFGIIKELNFDKIKASIEAPTVNPEAITPLEKYRHVYPGLYRYLISNNQLKSFIEGKPIESISCEDTQYIETDDEQNKAVNLILSEPSIAVIIGERGTGKKFVVKKAIEEINKKSKSSAVVTQTRFLEFKEMFSMATNVFDFADDSIFLSESAFDYLFLFLDKSINEKDLKAYAGLTSNLIILSLETPRVLPQKVDDSRMITLKKEHRFGSRINHFLTHILDYPLESGDEEEIKIINKENVDSDYLPIVNPEKIVQLIEIQGSVKGNKNKWNEQEAALILEITKQFLKAGVERKSIGIIAPYERQKKLIQKLLTDEKIEGLAVYETEESFEKDIVILSLVDDILLRSPLTESGIMKLALTRAKSKLLVVGGKKTIKGIETISKVSAKL